MPITQDRLLATLEAGESFRDHYYALREQINHICSRHRTGHITAEAALQSISTAIILASPYMPADGVLRVEREHYRLTSAKNESEKRRARRIRLAAGITPRTNRREIRHTAPTASDTITTNETAERLQRIAASDQADQEALNNFTGSSTTEPPTEELTDEEKRRYEEAETEGKPLTEKQQADLDRLLGRRQQ